MKIKNLLLLVVMAVFSMNAFAADSFEKKDGIWYRITPGDATHPFTAIVTGISTGMSDAAAATITIPATIKDGDNNNVLVVGLGGDWTACPGTGNPGDPVDGDGGAGKDIKALAKNVTIDVTNFTAAFPSGAFSTLTKLESVTITGTSTIDGDYTFPYLTLGGTGKIKLDLSGLAAKSGKKLILEDNYYGTSRIKEIKVPAAMTGINFKGCDGLEKVDGIKEVKDNAFQNCGDLTTVVLAEGATIGKLAFDNAAKLATINMGVATSIGEQAFKDTKISAIDLAAAKSVGANAFNGTKVASLTIPAQVETIANSAFNGITDLKTVVINVDNDKNKTIGTWFGTNATIEDLTINTPKVEKIAADAFKSEPIAKLSITAPALTTIESDAFAAATITKVNLNSCEKLATVADDAFQTNAYTEVQLGNTALTAVPTCFLTNSAASLTKLGMPQAMTTIPANMLNGFTALKAIDLPKKLQTIGASAFEGMTALESIVIPAKVTSIGTSAFEGCTHLATADLSGAAALETIGNNAFYGCYYQDPVTKEETGLASIVIPAKVTSIGMNAFDGCKLLASVDFSAAAALEEILDDAFAGTAIKAIDLSACAKLATITATSFPVANYTSVKLAGTALVDADFATALGWLNLIPDAEGKSAKTTLKEITIPAEVTAIPDDAFNGFKALTSVGLPKKCKTIGARAFEASGLTAFKIRENVQTIGQAAFKDCEDLAIVNFSEATSLKGIPAQAFQNCAALTAVDLSALATGEELTWVGGSAFRNSGVKEIALPASVTTFVGGYQFADCKKLKSFSAKGLTGAIGDNTFENCVKLTGIVIPVGVTDINDNAFKGCTTLATVTFKYDPEKAAEGLQTLGASVFEGCAALTALDLNAAKYSNGGLYAGTNDHIFKGCTSLATVTFPAEGFYDLDVAGLFADAPIEDFDLSGTEINNLSGVLFGKYYDKTGNLQNRDTKNPNTTLKSIKVGGVITAYCFANCTALESAEVYDVDATMTPAHVNNYVFEHCTGLKTFTYNREVTFLGGLAVDDLAFSGCVPYIQFVTNDTYMDNVVAANGGVAPLNSTFGDAEITTIKTVQDKANPNQFVAKFVYTRKVKFNAEKVKVYTVYVDGETAYFQACRTFEGYYYIPANEPVILKTSEEAEVSYELVTGMGTPSSIGWNDMYASQAGNDLAAVQNGAFAAQGIAPAAGYYLYRLTNTADQGFGFTSFTGTTIKEGQFFIVSKKKPEGAARLNMVWLDEDGNVEGEATAIKGVKNIDANNGAIYNLQGVRVDNPVKGGLYIQNGKKIVVK